MDDWMANKVKQTRLLSEIPHVNSHFLSCELLGKFVACHFREVRFSDDRKSLVERHLVDHELTGSPLALGLDFEFPSLGLIGSEVRTQLYTVLTIGCKARLTIEVRRELHHTEIDVAYAGLDH